MNKTLTDDLRAELEWCIADGNCGPRTRATLVALRALLAAQQPEPRAEVTGWQPIETAPKDGTPLVMFARYVHATASIVVVASWLENYGMWVNQSFSCAPVQQVVPSHWMARPEFPIDAARAGGGQ